MKKLMLLGGSRYLMPVIEAAKKRGCYVITCDYLPDNYAHKYSDEYVNVSIIEKEAVLKAAKEREIDGILSFACDPGVVTAAYVADNLKIPYVADYDTVCLLQNKNRFRSFLRENGFNVPEVQAFTTITEAKEAMERFSLPIIVKPVDSAGSKGVTKVDNYEQYQEAIEFAFSKSICKEILVEEFIESMGDPTDCDCFSIDGHMQCVTFSNQKFDNNAANPFTPAGFTFPSEMSEKHRMSIASDLERLCSLLKLGTSIYNVEARVRKDGKTYLMEVSPRGGGNRLAEMVRYTTGIDLIEASISAALGEKVENIDHKECEGYWYEHILHTNESGVYCGVEIDDRFKQNLIEYDLWVENGDFVSAFTGANETIGTLIFKFNEKTNMDELVNNLSEYIKVVVK